MAIVLVDLVLPLQTFTFRQWEALENNTPAFAYGPFYPNQEISMIEFGDLGRHTPYEIGKPTTWRTDQIGFRNDQYIKEPDILLIGDSYFAGSSVTQDSTIVPQLHHALGKLSINREYKIYNIAPSSFAHFNYLMQSGIIKKPGTIIFSIAERSVRSMVQPVFGDQLSTKQKLINGLIEYMPYQVLMILDRAVKLNILRYTSAKLNPVEWTKNRADDRRRRAENMKHPRMLFFKDGKLPDNDSLPVYDHAINVLSGYKDYCNKLGIKLIFVPIPDKQTVYYYKVSSATKQSVFLEKLDSLIKRNNITAINTLKLFNETRNMDSSRFLYFYDDVHWNPYGVNILADELAKTIVSETNLK